jgi:hypothetical protein
MELARDLLTSMVALNTSLCRYLFRCKLLTFPSIFNDFDVDYFYDRDFDSDLFVRLAGSRVPGAMCLSTLEAKLPNIDVILDHYFDIGTKLNQNDQYWCSIVATKQVTIEGQS